MIRLSSNGNYWLATWKNSTGGRQSKSLGPKSKVSKAAAKRMMMDLAREVVTSSTLRDGVKVPTLGAWKTKYFTLRTDLSEGTVTLHEKTFDYLIQFVRSDDVTLDRIKRDTASDFREWLTKMKDPRGERQMGPTTVAGHIRICKVIFAHAVKVDLLDFNPFDRESGSAPKVIKNWAQIGDDELAKILAACPDVRWRALFQLTRWAGLRRGEALRLTWADVDFGAKTLRVVPEGDHETTKARVREVPMRPVLAAAMQDAYDEQEKSLGPCQFEWWGNIDRDVRLIIKRALGSVYAKPFHTLRKCCESEWMAVHPIMDVCQWMGHGPEVAKEHYTRASKASIENVTGAQPQKVTVMK